MDKKWWLCFLVLGALGVFLQDRLLQPSCSLSQCLAKRPGRYVVQAPRVSTGERYLQARGEKLHRHGDFLIYETGPDSLRHVLEVGEAETIASAVVQANLKLAGDFECLRDARGTVTGLRRGSTPTRFGGSGLDLARIAHELHPDLAGWWSAPDTLSSIVLTERYHSYFEPIHHELHRQELLRYEKQLRAPVLGSGGKRPECGPRCGFRPPEPAGELPPQLWHPDGRHLVILGGLKEHAQRLLRGRGEQLSQQGAATLLERRGEVTLNSLIAAAELEALEQKVGAWNSSALMGSWPQGSLEYEIRYADSGEAVAVELGQRVIRSTNELTDFYGGPGLAASAVLSVGYPALATSDWLSCWDLPTRYEPLVKAVRERAERVRDPFQLLP